MNVQFRQRCLSMLLVLVMLFTMMPAPVIAEEHDHAHETTETPVVTAEEAVVASTVAELVVSASSSATYMYVDEAPVTVTAKIAGGMAPYEVTLQAVKDGEVVSNSKVTTESPSASLTFAPASYGDYELVVLVHDALHTQVLTSVSLAVAEHDIESEAEWAASVSGASVGSNWASSLLSVAKTQVGYTESEKDFIIKSGAKQGYSRYGAWYGTPYANWNTTFVSFVTEYANIPTDGLLSGTSYRSWVNGMSAKDAYMPADGTYSPRSGDIAFLSNSRVAIVESFDGSNVNVIEGDVNGAVVRKTYSLSKLAGVGNTGLMMGLHTGSATPVPTATPEPTKVPGDIVIPTISPKPTAKPTATPMPEFEDLIAVATATPGPGVTVAPKDDEDVLAMMGAQVGDTVEQLAAEATAVPMERSEAFYLMQDAIRELQAKYLGEGDKTPAEIKAYVDSLEMGDLFYITVEVDELEEYARSIGISEYELMAVFEVEDTFASLVSLAENRFTDLTVERAETNLLDGQVKVYANLGTITPNGSDGAVITYTISGMSLGTNYTFTFTNLTDSKATLSFEYSGTSFDSFSLSSKTGTVTELLDAGGQYSITAKSTCWSGQTDTLTISNMTLVPVADTSNVTFTFDETLGSVTVDGAAVTNNYSAAVSGTNGALVAATANNGTTFLGWRDVESGAILSTATSFTYTPTADATVEAVFVAAGSRPWFLVGTAAQKSQSSGLLGMSKLTYYTVSGTHMFDDLNEAATYASNNTAKYIVLMNSGTLPAGDYTIPAGVTLLIPFDSANTLFTTQVLNTGTYTKPTAYRTLTMADGANLIINGAMSLSATQKYANGGAVDGGAPTGPVSFVKMEGNSNITINNGGVLYAYGFITGNGSVTANSGATVYEMFQISDFRGGTQSTDMKNGVFPISQYYVQNIEVPLTLYSGATEYSYTTIYMSSADFGSSVAFIARSGAMFNLSSGYVVKRYDGTTDRLVVEAHGNMSVDTISMDVGGKDINSADYELGVNGNITVTVKSGATITMNQDLALLPGSEIIVENGAKCVLGRGYNVYVYDVAQWSTYCSSTNKKFVPVAYAPGKTYTRTDADLKDAMIQADGELDASAGYLYTTADGANIYSTGTGVAIVNPGTETVTYQLVQNTGYTEIPITSAKLKNADGSSTSYTETAAGGADTYNYNAERGVWECGDHSDTLADGENACADKTCTVCGYVQDGTDHTVVVDAAVAPTCEATGLTEGKHCSVCGTVTVEQTVVDALGHSYSEEITTAPGCLTEGVKTFTCGTCGDTYTETIAATGHTEVIDAAVASTCTETGLTEGKHCSVCDELLVKQTEVAALGHDKKNVKNEQAATCIKTGLITYECTRCKTVYSEDIPLADHTDEVTARKGMTQNADGEWVLEYACVAGAETYNCSVCGNNEREEVVPATAGHTEETITGTPADCATGTNGLTDGVKCSVCGDILEEQEVIEWAHTEGDEVTVEPDCEAGTNGYSYIECSVCHAELSRVGGSEVPYLHTYEEKVLTEATCTTTGEKANVCTECGAEEADSRTTIPATNHPKKVETVTQAATCVVPGIKTISCPDCDYYNDTNNKVEIDLDPTNHANIVTDAAVSASCTEKGLTEGSHCAACNTTIVAQEEVPAKGHDIDTPAEDTCATQKCETCGNDVVGTKDHNIEKPAAATCATQHCNVCDTDVVGLLPHTEVIDEVKAPTCSATGLTEGKHCSVCDTVIVAQEVVNKLPHTEAVDAAKAPTCTETGLTEGKHCSVCGTVILAQEEVKALGHNYGEGVVTAECGTYKCIRCEKDIKINADAQHTIPEDSYACKGYVCSFCEQEVAGTGEHTYSEATCTTLATCVCGETTGALAAHTIPADWACTASYTCSVCENTVTDENGTHAYSDPTCDQLGVCVCGAENTEAGYRKHKLATPAAETCATQKCQYEDCGAEVAGELEHEWQKATCVAPKTCSACGATEGEADTVYGHSYTEEQELVAATCAKEGYVIWGCANGCNSTMTETLEIDDEAHPAEALENRPAITTTCSVDGRNEGTYCTACDTYATGGETTVQAYGAFKYTNEKLTEDVDATCNAGGYTVEYCFWYGPETGGCDHKRVVEETEADPNAHVKNESTGFVSQAPTCTTPGVMSYYCVYHTTTVAATTEIPVVADAHVSTEGWTCGDYTCKECGESITGTGNHDILDENGNGNEKQPTCLENVTCNDCGAEVKEATGHAFAETERADCGTYECLTCHEGITEGGTHAYDVDYTCADRTCTKCSELAAGDGEHDMAEATCVANATCKDCGYQEEGTKLDTHVWDAQNPVMSKEPTCTEMGQNTYKCTVEGCTATDVRTEILAKGHKVPEGWACTASYTCSVCSTPVTDEEGEHAYSEATCTVLATCVCGATTGELKAHTFAEEWTCGTRVCTVCENPIEGDNQHDMAAATCMVKSTCKDCGHVEGELADHVYSVVVKTVEPTCSENGYTVYSCVYGCDNAENRDTVNAFHPEDMLVEKERIAPTCVAQGNEAGIYCTKCNTYTKGGEVIAIDNDAHVAGTEYDVTIEMTCQNDGEHTYYCIYHADKVAKTETVTCDPENHTWEELDAVQATCVTDGYHSGKECIVEGCPETDVAGVIPALGHNYVPTYDETKVSYNEETKKWVLTDCDVGTTVTYTCNREGCTEETPNHSYEENIEAKDHVGETIPAVEATCYKTGLTEGTKCATCGEILEAQKTTDMLDHTKGEPIVVAPNCVDKEDGYTYYVCTVAECSAKFGHTDEVDWTEGHALKTSYTEPTCKTNGYNTTICEKNCGYEPVVVYDDPDSTLDHDYSGEGTKETAPTCTEKGYTTYTCQRENCGDSYVDNYTDPLEHQYEVSSWEEDKVSYNEETKTWVLKDCDVPAKVTYVCKNDKSHTHVETIQYAHTEETIPAVDATCYATGLTEGTKCATCGEILVEQKTTEMIDHSWGEAIVVAPNCVTEEDGYTYYECTVEECKAKSDKREFVSWEKAHDLVSEYTEPTCQADGYTTTTCNKGCDYNEVVTDENSKLPHNYEGGIEVTDPTCEEKGYTTYTCQNEGCGHTETGDEVSATGHKYENEGSKVVVVGCFQPGYTIYTCDVCGDVKRDDYTDPVGDHTLVTVVEAKAATCLEAGNTEGKACKYCDFAVPAKTIDPLQHLSNMDAATCTEDKVCTREDCGMVLQEALGHDFTDVLDASVACRDRECERCGTVKATAEHTYSEDEANKPCIARTCLACSSVYGQVEASAEHQPDEGEITTTPTCTAEGVKTFYCKVCDEVTGTAPVAKVAHEHEAINTVAPTCTAQGYTTYKCKNCEDSYDADYTEMVAHTWDTGKITTEPGCETTGVRTYTCTVCKTATKTEDVDATGHTEVPMDDVEATCTTDGSTGGTKCSVCDKTLTEATVIQMTQHKGTTVTLPAKPETCTENGLKAGMKCTACGVILLEQDVIDEIDGHDIVIDEAVAATCYSTGWTAGQHCTRCDEATVERTVVEKIDHTTKIVTGTAATCTTTGLTDGEQCTVPECKEWVKAQEVIDALGHTEEELAAVAPTCTATGLTAGVKCSVCGVTLEAQQIVNAKGHTKVVDAAVDATCTATGLTEGSHCSVCGEVLVAQTVVDAKGHKEKIVSGYAATCTVDGLTDGKECTVCGTITVEQETITAPGHTKVTVPGYAAECEKPGLTDGEKCSVCGTIIVAQEEITALEHAEKTLAAVAATCTTPGWTEGKQCTVCSTITVAQELVPAKGHTPVVDAAVPPTCEATGLTEGSHCGVCDTPLKEQTEVSATGHAYQGVVTNAATCTEAGLMTYTCQNDPTHTYTEEIKATGHTLTNVEAKAPTCEAIGWNAYEYCSVCTYTTYEEIPATDHKYEGVVTTPATCTEAGVKTYTCQNDPSHTYTEEIEATGHTLTNVEAKAPTCEEIGWNAYEKCSACDYSTYEEIPATDHDYEGVVTTPATCTEAGVMTYTCKNDPTHTYTEEIKAAHKTEVVDEVAPTCTEEGKKVIACTVEGCDYTTTETIPATGHTEVVDPRVEPTCEVDGLTEGSHCSVCKETLKKQETIPAGHTWSGYPCTDEGVYCTVCKELFGEKVNHKWTAATCTAPATCTYCGLTDGTALGHQPVKDDDIPARCETEGYRNGMVCKRCGIVTTQPTVLPALGHDMQPVEAKVPTYNSIGWNAHQACSRCGKTEGYEKLDKLPEPTISSYEEFITYLPLLEELAAEYAKANPGTDPVDLIIKYIRTGVERYNSGSWGIMAGYENAGFAKYVIETEDMINLEIGDPAQMIKVTGLKNLVNFALPEGQVTDMGHTFGTMDITNNNPGSVNHADVGGWAGDLVDLLSTSDHDDHQEELLAVINGDLEANFEAVVTYIRTSLLCKEHNHGDVFSQTDFIGDLDAFYILDNLDTKNYNPGDMTALFQGYFTSDLSDEIRADYLLKNRLDEVATRSAIRNAVYNAYTTNTVISTLEATREFVNTSATDLITMRRAVCYAFADHLCMLAGYWVDVTENEYLTDYESSYEQLAPGISMEVHKATSADNKNMVYYLGYADLSNPYVQVMANYQDRDVSSGWGMVRVLDQAERARKFHSDPETEYYIENFAPIVAINGSGFNMSTGEPSGLLVMHGQQYHAIDRQGFFGITKSGKAVIGSMADYNADEIQEGIAGFGTMLVENGELAKNIPTSNYYSSRASRTAVGITGSGAVVFMVLDGRQEPWSCGGSMIEIAQIMQLAGCVTAINLDGGGSSTFVARRAGADELSVINRPSDGISRSVSTSLMIVSTAPSSTAFDHAVIESPYNYMTIGSEMQMTGKGVSPTGNEVKLPEGITWAVSDELWASITEEGVVTAKRMGSFEVYLMLDGVIVGQKTVNVINPDQLYFSKDKVNCFFGETVDLQLKARYEGKEVTFLPSDVTFTISPETAGTVEGLVFNATTDTSIRSVVVTATLATNAEVTAEITVQLYSRDEAGFDFDNVTSGDRTLALVREVSNSTCAEGSSIYYIVDKNQPMVTSYTIGLDMTQIPMPEQLADLTYMLPGADKEGASAWTFLMQLAERISVLTTVRAKLIIDPNFDVDIKDLKLVNEYFKLNADQTVYNEADNTLTVTLSWIDQTAPIPAEEADPLCVVSGLKLTPKTDATWDDKGRLVPVNEGHIEYTVYMRANALYTFSAKPENQKLYGLREFINPDDPSERGGYFSGKYADFTDTYTLVKMLKNGWLIEDGGFRYYIDNEYLTGIQLVEGYYYYFDENGINIAQEKYTGKYHDGQYAYYIQNGEKAIHKWFMLEDGWYYFSKDGGKGLVGKHATGFEYIVFEFGPVDGNGNVVPGKLVSGEWYYDGTGYKYYYGPGNYHEGWQIIDGETYFFDSQYRATGIRPVRESTDLRTYWYEFDADGKLIGRVADGLYWYNDKLYFVKDALAESKGMVEFEGDYYFVRMDGSGSVLVNESKWIEESEMNGLPFSKGTYRFDENGRMIRTTGVINENGTLYYYLNGVRTADAGLIEFEGEYYHVGSKAICAVNKTAWVEKDNVAGLPAGTYRFDENGHIVLDTAVVYSEADGEYHYYLNGKRTSGAGLVYDHGYYYYFESGQIAAATDKEIYVGKNNLGLEAGTYRFGTDAKAILETELVEENDGLYYYKNGKLAVGAGLIKYEDAYYYIDENGKAVTDAMQEITAAETIDHFGPDTYEFGSDGKMIIREGIYNGYWYANGTKTAAGLVEFDGDYYYAAAGGKLITDTKYEITQTNDLPLEAGVYRFDAEGKIIMTTEVANEDGVYYYYDNGRLAKDAGLIKIGEDYYYITADGTAIAGKPGEVVNTNGLPLEAGTYRFDAEGKIILTTDLVEENGKYAYYKDGRLALGANLIEFNGDYYWIDQTGHALVSTSILVRNGDLLPYGIYRVEADGKVNLKTEVAEEKGKLYYYQEGILTANAGIVLYEGAYYFIGADGLAAVDTKIDVTRTQANDKLTAGTYRFGTDGKAIMTTRLETDETTGAIYYFEEGRLATSAGLIKYNGAYYYIDENGCAVTNTKVDVPANDLGLDAGTYRFGADGKAILTTELADEDGELIYYLNGKLTKDAGLINLNGSYYYITENGSAARDTELDVQKTNGLLDAGVYRFGADGKAILTTELVMEDGKLNYYVQGKLATDAGLIQYKDGYYYYIKADGSAAMNEKVDVTEEKAHGHFPADTYEFGADGKMVIYDGVIVNGYYYENGVKTEAGLVQIGEDYYYAAEGGKVVTGTKYEVTQTNDLPVEAGIYRFDEDGKVIMSTELVDEDGKLTYYEDGKLAEDAGLIKVGEDYYYIGEDGTAVTNKQMLVEKTNDLLPADTYCFGEDGKMFERLAGDADENGTVNIYDALRILKYASGEEVEINLLNANVNEDDKVDANDAMTIMKVGAGWNVVLK